MKKIFLLIVLITLFHHLGSAQDQSILRDIKNIALMKVNNNKSGVLLGDKVSKVIQVLGKPDKISDFYSEIDDKILKLYHYGKNELLFDNDILAYYELNDPSIMMGTVNSKCFRVGDRIPTITKFIHAKKIEIPSNSFYGLKIQTDRSVQPVQKFTYAYLKNGNVNWDLLVSLLFDGDNLKTVRIVSP